MRRFALLLAAATLPASAMAAPPKTPSAAAEAQVLELSRQALAIRSVRGEGNRTIDVAKLYKQALLGAGWADKDVEITPVDDTAYLVATWQGSDPKLKPLVISGHMDVVEATMPGVIAAEETERSIDMFVHTREFELTLDPLAATPQDAIHALTDYLNGAIGIPATPITQEG